MRSGKTWILVIALFSTVLAGSSFAADRYVRLRSVEGEVSIHPSDGQRSTEATINTPLMNGDEIQTGEGRAELSFQNGITVRIGDYSGLRLESSYSPMIIDLLQGTAFVDSHLIDRFRDELVVRAGDAEVSLLDEGNIRVDLGSEGSIRVTTIQGQAEVEANGRRVLLNSGERTYIDPGRSPQEPEQFRGQNDELDDWNESRMDFYAQGDFGGGYNDEYVDEDIYYDSYDLGGYGDWRQSGSYGYVWVPHVDYGWRPYYDGRWSYANNSWFWISYEPWGWAPYHYGRWGWSLNFGWYWIPGNVFAPSWVSWYSYGDYIGWCPLNYYNNPIYYWGHNYNYNYNYNRFPAIQKQKTLDATNSWTFVKKSDLGVKNIKKSVLNGDHVRNFKIDRDKVSTRPQKELVSYVIPKTVQGPAYVNDKQIIKQPGDIKNPVGTKNREEQFERPGKVNRTFINKGSKATERNYEKPSREPVKIQPTKPQSLPKPKDDWDRGKKVDRDLQFKRNEGSSSHYSPYSNPYYKDKNRTYQRFEGPSKGNPWSRKPSDESYDRPRDVNPKYLDEAKKYFERFDHKNRDDSYKTAPKSYEPPQRTYEAPKQNYEAPKREYKAPEIKRNDYSNRSNQNNNRSKSSSSNNHNIKKRPN